VPVFGFALLAMSHGDYGLGEGWVLAGLALWLVAAGVTESYLWPAERRIAEDLAGWVTPADNGPGAAALDPAAGVAWRDRCRPVFWAALGVIAALVVASALMVVRP
jgi:hypothetical protein